MYKPTKRESLVSAAIMLVLVVVAVWVYYRQFRHNPAVAALSIPLIGFVESVETGHALFNTLPEGVVPMGGLEVFSPETLSEKINGKAELYLEAGFVELGCQRFSFSGGDWVEVFAFDMGEAEAAFAAFSQQRREGVATSVITEHAYWTGNGLFLVHGPHYLELVGSKAGDELRPVFESLARQFQSEHPLATRASASVLSLFPEEGLIPNSIELLSSNVFGCERLDTVCIGRYRQGGQECMLFVSARQSPEEASELAEAYYEFLLECGGRLVVASRLIEGTGPFFEGYRPETTPVMRVVDMDGFFESISHHEAVLIGVHEANSPQTATTWLALLRRHVRETGQ